MVTHGLILRIDSMCYAKPIISNRYRIRPFFSN